MMKGEKECVVTKSVSARLLSLDAFRGLVIVLMFLVNVGGTDPAFTLGSWAAERYRVWMPHMGWNGGRMGNGLADYVFPWFLFIVGVAIPFSMSGGRGAGRPAGWHMLVAVRRGVVLYLLGSLMWMATIGYKPQEVGAVWNGPIDWRVLLHWDILPLIGFGYALAAVLFHGPRWVRGGFLVAVLGLKWYLLKGNVPTDCAGWVDAIEKKVSVQQTLGARLGIPGWWATLITQGLAFTTVVVIGTLVGDVIRARPELPGSAARKLALAGAGMTFVAVATWIAGDMPFSKDLVSPTYVLLTCGTGMLVLAGMMWVVDVRRVTTLEWLRVFGVNALFAYVLAELVWKMALVRWQVVLPANFQPAAILQGGKPESGIAITAIKAWMQSWVGMSAGTYVTVGGYILAYWLLCLLLYRKRVFVKV